jgi:uncharacterized protein
MEGIMVSRIEKFLSSAGFAVAGASSDRSKYGNKCLRCYLQHGMTVIGVNPKEKEVEGALCVASVADLPPEVKSLTIVTPPQVTERVVKEAIAHGIENIWMQPGAESGAAIQECEKSGVNVIADGSCILVKLGYRDH